LLGDDLLAVLDATASGRRAHLIGHDWGGLQGWEFATLPRFAERLASFTAVAAPSIDQVALAGLELRRRPWAALARAWRSWYILVLLTPGGPELTWRLLINEQRWRQELRRQGVPSQADIPRPTLASDGIFGANLYRRNMPRRVLSPRRDAFAHVPVQLIIPTRDRYIPVEYYDLAESYAPRLQRHELDATHWVPLTHSDVVADLIRGFVTGIEAES
jgi:pimeloyl-ACP methyl ester carboxylesterase